MTGKFTGIVTGTPLLIGGGTAHRAVVQTTASGAHLVLELPAVGAAPQVVLLTINDSDERMAEQVLGSLAASIRANA